jgi:uncharacterized protein (TIGR03086 family)
MLPDSTVVEDAGVRNRAGDGPILNDAITQLIHQGRDREAAALGSERLASATRGAPMDPIAQLDEIVPLLTRLVASVTEEQLEAPTPCGHFDVRQVFEHMLGGATLFAAAFRGTPPPGGDLPRDVLAALPAALEGLRDALRTPGALDRTIVAPFGEVRGEMFARFVALDGLVHGWDIATATGQPYDPPEEVVAAVDAFAHQAIGEAMRDGDTFAAAMEPPAGASPLVRLVAFTGRTVD